MPSKLQPEQLETMLSLAETTANGGDYEQAIEQYGKIIGLNPEHATAHYKRGNLFRRRHQFEAAVADYNQAVLLDPGFANAFCNRGVALTQLDRLVAALESFDTAIALNANDFFAYYNRGIVQGQLKQPQAALASYNKAIAIKPDYVEALCNRGILLAELTQWDAALASYSEAIEVNPRFSPAYLNRGALLQQRKQWDAALDNYDQAIVNNPGYAAAHCARGLLLAKRGEWQAALASLDQAIAVNADFAEAYFGRGILFMQLQRNDLAIENFDKAIAFKPDYTDAVLGRANARLHMKQFPAAIADFDRVIADNPNYRFAFGMRRHAKMNICEWRDWDTDLKRLSAGIKSGEAVSPPFPVLALLDAAALQKKSAEIWIREEHDLAPVAPTASTRTAGDKIRIGYFSGDFHDHPVAIHIAQLLESQDRAAYEATAFSFGPDTGDPMQKRLVRSFDRFINVGDKSDRDIALLARSLSIDIAVDLGGHSGSSRTRIFACRAAAIQASFLGYAGTMGADYIDYLVADLTAIPQFHAPHYTEKIIYLPNSFMPNDSTRTISDRHFTRAELGLPATGFVFCCFNNNYKITPSTFDSWMRILNRCENSVLWLAQNNSTAADNLRVEASRRGIDPQRLIFAARMPSQPEHLARQRAADLFLDTLPYNAHATAVDALWVGLPVLTRAGEAFAGRVAASLLNAIDLPELITTTVAEYENLAVHLAKNPLRLKEMRQKLATNRLSTPLFNTPAFASHLEEAYAQVHARHRAGLAPEHIFVAKRA